MHLKVINLHTVPSSPNNLVCWHSDVLPWDLGSRLRMGRADAQVCGGAGAHVVAELCCGGLHVPVRWVLWYRFMQEEYFLNFYHYPLINCCPTPLLPSKGENSHLNNCIFFLKKILNRTNKPAQTREANKQFLFRLFLLIFTTRWYCALLRDFLNLTWNLKVEKLRWLHGNIHKRNRWKT